MFFWLKAFLSGLIIAAVSSLARRYPGFGALVASLPLISILGMIWLWQETKDPARMEAHVSATLWYVLPSLPMFLLIPWAMRHGVPFYAALLAGCVVTTVLYLVAVWLASRFGISP
ncbi:hypothetical protein AD948_00525 [Acetobacter senegalensis]|uniref:DUF3147 family protein n=1 Tax=Acetobacter senegalensis TaxID=446692 RepID=A0A149U8I5_9PROT|nr:DUF3147 family protein [Acetobacter senegalensis]KXV61763.1 hypothetical protein AD948_00525 [Acetobacter senegalensis]MCG4274324.1 DUF3147 family protein [Acetobacter senegalensis]